MQGRINLNRGAIKMAKQYIKKQVIIDEQAATIKKLEAQLAREKDVLAWRDQQLKEQCEKLYEIRSADVVVTVFEEDYHVNHPAVILSQTQLCKEDFYMDQPAMVEKALKLRDSLSEFYQNHNHDVRISVSINSI
jgi:LmbE family N-acetylglucosaminyl deacetylase